MLTTETNPSTAETHLRAGRKYSALEQCRAVLLVWSERKSATEVCRALKISNGLLSVWQERAMEGMLAAVEPREGREIPEKGPALSGQLKRLLEKKVSEREGLIRRTGRLARLTGKSQPAGPPPAAMTTGG